MLEAGAARQPASAVAADQEGQQERYQDPDEACDAARLGLLADALVAAEDCAYYGADDAAQDQAGAKGR